MKLKEKGYVDASFMMKDMKTPTRAMKYRKAFSKNYTKIDSENVLAAHEALKFIIEAGLSKRQYILIINAANFFPAYDLTVQERKKCYPYPEA